MAVKLLSDPLERIYTECIEFMYILEDFFGFELEDDYFEDNIYIFISLLFTGSLSRL